MNDPPLLAYAVGLVALFAVEWVALTAALWVLRRFVDVTIPEPREFLRLTAAAAAVGVALSLVPWVGWILGAAAVAWLVQRWFDADLAGAVIVVLVVAAVWRVVDAFVLVRLAG